MKFRLGVLYALFVSFIILLFFLSKGFIRLPTESDLVVGGHAQIDTHAGPLE